MLFLVFFPIAGQGAINDTLFKRFVFAFHDTTEVPQLSALKFDAAKSKIMNTNINILIYL